MKLQPRAMFFQEVRENYGNHNLQKLKQISSTYTNLAKQKNKRIFLLRCKNEDVYPTFLNINVNHIKPGGTYLENKFSNIVNSFKNKILNLVLSDTTHNINKLERVLNENITYLRNVIPENKLTTFLNFEKIKYEKIFTSIKQKNQRKLHTLIKNSEIYPTNNISTNWLENISDTQIPNKIAEILALGPNFSIKLNSESELPTTEYIACVESVIYDQPIEIKESIRSEVVNVITNHKIKLRHNKFKTNKTQKIIQKQLMKTKIFLKNNPQISILKPDKSNKTVIMNTSDYINKMNDLLNDTNTYKKIKSDPTNVYQKKNNSYIKKLLNKQLITESESKHLTIHNAISPKIYGLPKLHKANIPLRPIVSSIQSPFYNLSKYLSNCISNITGKNDYYIKDSFSFKEFIDNVSIPNHYKLVSLDVISLYTNIPIELVTKIIEEKWIQLKNYTTLSKNEFIEGLNLTLSNNYFQFQDNFYLQIDGCAMGSPISSTIAQLVMEHLEETVLRQLTTPRLFFKRYVDDCLTAIPENAIAEVLNKFNSFHQKLQFTSEAEQNGRINFLDLTLIRNQNNKIDTSWYTKPTWSGRYLNYNSNHAPNQKHSVIIGLADRAIQLTTPKYRPEALNKVRNILKNNNFPQKLTNKIIKQRIFKYYNNRTTKPIITNNTSKKYIAIPYVNSLSEKIKHILNKHNIITCHKGYNLINQVFTPLKSKTPKKKKSNVVYSIKCSNCPKTYIGMTTQSLNNRLNGHKYQKSASTALNKHESETKHTFDYENTRILNHDKNYQKLAIKEMIHIKKEPNSVNSRRDIESLSAIYFSLLQ